MSIHNRWTMREIVIGLTALFGGGAVIWLLGSRWWLTALIVAALLIGFHFREQIPSWLRAAFVGFIMAVILTYSGFALQIMRVNIANPPQWDFHLFWTFGQASAQGKNPYHQEYLLNLAAPLNPSDELVAELYFFHAPPTLFLFAPLGWFDIHTAYLVWYILNGILLLVDILLLWRLFFNDRGLIGLLMVAGIVLVTYPTLANLHFGQLNYLLLLFVLLLWRHRDQPIAGLWLTLGIFVKPIILVLGLYILVRRGWRQIGIALITGVMISIATSLVYGTEMFFGYLSNNPIVNKMPIYLYAEPVNQSLLATILRLTNYNLDSGSPLLHPLFLATALLLTLLTVWLVYRMDEDDTGLGMALTLALALLIFPKTLTHYSFLLLLPLFLIWKQREKIPSGVIATLAFITIVEVFMFVQNGDWTFLSYLLTWLFIAFLIFSFSHVQYRRASQVS